MEADELAGLIEQRHTILARLLEFGNRQIAIIAAGRMSELMRLLAEKQAPLQQLAEISQLLRGASDDDPEQRRWTSPQARDRCRLLQTECERMHVELLAIEAECEAALQECRSRTQQEIEQLDAARQAARGYAHAQDRSTCGGQLDLSSEVSS